jgi:hypothetical protein
MENSGESHSIACKYPAWLEERMRVHQQVYGANLGTNDMEITVPMSHWLRVQRMAISWKMRYRRGYQAGYEARRKHEEIQFKPVEEK